MCRFLAETRFTSLKREHDTWGEHHVIPGLDAVGVHGLLGPIAQRKR